MRVFASAIRRAGYAWLLTLAAISSAEAATATWDRNPESNIAGYILSYGTQSGQHTVSIDVGNVTTHQFFPPAGQRYYVVVQAYTTTNAVGPKSAEIIFDTQANLPPTLQQPANQTSLRNTAVSLTLVGVDPEGATKTYSATGLPAGLSLNASTGVIGGTVTTAGIYTVTATVSDGSLSASRTFTWTVTAPPTNQPPTLQQPANQSSARNAAVSLALVGSDPEGAALRYSAAGLPAGLTINATTGLIAGTVTTAGTSTVTATVSDGALTASRAFTWTVTTVNQPPTLQQPANQSSVQNATVSLALIGSDLEGAALRFSASGLPTGLAVNATTGAITGIVTTTGTFNVNAIVSDGSLSAGRSFTWTVVAPNQPPTLDRPASQLSVRNSSVSLALIGRDPENAPLTFSATGLPPGLSINAATGVIAGTPTIVGTFYPTARVSDGSSTTSREFTWTITAPVNQAPALQQPANQSTVRNSAVSLALLGSDPEGTSLTYSATGLPLGLSINAATGVIAGTVTTAGTSTVTASVSDGSLSVSRTFTWTVTAPNQPPTLTQPADQISDRNAAISLALVGADPEGRAITYSASGLPTGLTLNATSGAITGAPTAVGTFNVNVSVSDGSLSQSRAFTWTVIEPNRPPTLQNQADQVNKANDTVSLQLSASDPDGTALAYQVNDLPPGLTVNASTGLISGTVEATAAGIYNVVAAVSDGQFTATLSFTWSIGGDDRSFSADFDGDGKADPATYRASTGQWRVWASSNAYALAGPLVWGEADDIPVPADYDGDRRADVAIYRPSTGSWLVLLSSSNYQSQMEVQWGDPQDRPTTIDHDEDGKADLALPRFGGFMILLSGSNYTTSVSIR